MIASRYDVHSPCNGISSCTPMLTGGSTFDGHQAILLLAIKAAAQLQVTLLLKETQRTLMA